MLVEIKQLMGEKDKSPDKAALLNEARYTKNGKMRILKSG